MLVIAVMWDILKKQLQESKEMQMQTRWVLR